jgi:trimethylamine--corrinoid protein Co-methyltransferase
MPSPHVTLLDLGDCEFIHEQTLNLLERVGVRIRSGKALAVLEEAGCKVDYDSGRTLFPAGLVHWALEQLQRDVLLAGRDKSHDIVLDGSRTQASVAGICPWIVDMDTGLFRTPTLRDVAQLTVITDALEAFGLAWYAVSPREGVSPKMADLAATACMLANTGKHVMGQVVRPEQVPYVLELMRLCSMGASPKDRPLFSSIYCPVAPLQHDGPAIEAAMGLAAEHVPIDIYSVGLAGATSPVTLAGTVTQTNCEILSALVLFQLVAPGCPLIYSANAAIMDMKTGKCAVSSPETILMNIGQIELAHSYGMPALSVGFVTDSSALGFRGGIEDIVFALPTRLARPDIMTGLGTLGSGQAVSYTKMVIDAELVGYLERLARGMTVDTDHVCAQDIAETGPGGHYLGRKSTRNGIRGGEHWIPKLLHRADGGKGDHHASEIEGATEMVSRILAEHTPLPLDPTVDERVSTLLTRATGELPDE